MARRVGSVVVRLRFAIVLAWISITVVFVLALPSVREAQSGSLGDLVPLGADAITAEERSAELQGVLGATELTFFVPIVATVLLVSLGSDHNVFIAGSIWAGMRRGPCGRPSWPAAAAPHTP